MTTVKKKFYLKAYHNNNIKCVIISSLLSVY